MLGVFIAGLLLGIASGILTMCACTMSSRREESWSNTLAEWEYIRRTYPQVMANDARFMRSISKEPS